MSLQFSQSFLIEMVLFLCSNESWEPEEFKKVLICPSLPVPIEAPKLELKASKCNSTDLFKSPPCTYLQDPSILLWSLSFATVKFAFHFVQSQQFLILLPSKFIFSKELKFVSWGWILNPSLYQVSSKIFF